MSLTYTAWFIDGGNVFAQSFQFNEGDPCAATTAGQITVGSGSITGTVNYHFADAGQPLKPVANVTLTAAGTPQVTATTNASGAYALNNLGTGPYTVTPAKTGDVNGITSQDAARAAQFAVGLATLTANQQIAADVTGNGTITSQDAARIAQFVAGLSVAGSTGPRIEQFLCASVGGRSSPTERPLPFPTRRRW